MTPDESLLTPSVDHEVGCDGLGRSAIVPCVSYGVHRIITHGPDSKVSITHNITFASGSSWSVWCFFIILVHFIHNIFIFSSGFSTMILSLSASRGDNQDFLFLLRVGAQFPIYFSLSLFSTRNGVQHLEVPLGPARLNLYSKKQLAKMLSKILSLMFWSNVADDTSLASLAGGSQVSVVKLSAGFCDYYFCFAAGQLLPGLA